MFITTPDTTHHVHIDAFAHPGDVVNVRVEPDIANPTHLRKLYIDVNGVTILRIGRIPVENLDATVHGFNFILASKEY